LKAFIDSFRYYVYNPLNTNKEYIALFILIYCLKYVGKWSSLLSTTDHSINPLNAIQSHSWTYSLLIPFFLCRGKINKQVVNINTLGQKPARNKIRWKKISKKKETIIALPRETTLNNIQTSTSDLSCCRQTCWPALLIKYIIWSKLIYT